MLSTDLVGGAAFACHIGCSPYQHAPPGSVDLSGVRGRDMGSVKAALGLAAFVSGALHVKALTRAGHEVAVVAPS